MKKIVSFLAITAISLTINPSNAQTVFWNDNFDGFGSPSIVTSSGTANGYNILFSQSAGTGEDFRAVFGFDYSTVSYPIPIPSAPNSLGGSTKGLYLTVNKSDATAANTAVNLYPVGQSFSGDYKLRFDVWMNWTNITTSTEHALFGINHSGNVTNRVSKTGSDGLFFAMSGDGGSSGTSTTARDFSVFAGQGSGAPLLYRTNNTVFSQQIGTQFDSANPGAAALFPSKTIPGYPTTPAGTPGLGWVQGEVRQEGSIITWLLDNTVIAQYNNTNSYTSGNVLIGYNDLFTSIGDPNNFAIFDNIVVSTIPEPATGVMAGLGLAVLLRRLRKI